MNHRDLNVVLVSPEIPPQHRHLTRLYAASVSRLHLVEPLGFSVTDTQLRRAGLDYWNAIQVHPSWPAVLETIKLAQPISLQHRQFPPLQLGRQPPARIVFPV